MAINLNCDGFGPHTEGTVKRMAWSKEPLSGGSIFCEHCWERELVYRRGRNKTLEETAKYDLPAWSDAEVYEVG